jgi:hypothetical protein
MYRSYQFLAEMKATSAGKLLDILPTKDVVVELLCAKFNVVHNAMIGSENYQHDHFLSRKYAVT